MFDDLLRELKNLKVKAVSVPIEADERGYIDRQCPSGTCGFLFKVNEIDWKKIFKDEAVWCPMCRFEAISKNWHTIEQIEHAKAEAVNQIKGRINKALKTDAEKFNRKQNRNSFIKMSMKVNHENLRSFMIPAKSAELMQLEIKCEFCCSRFAVVGSAYFCPACGQNSVQRTFFDSLRKIQTKINCVGIVKDAIVGSRGKDEAELTCKSLIETSLSDGVTAFQKFCEGMYSQFCVAPFNAFQGIDKGCDLWFEKVGKRYSDWLTAEELTKLKRSFQKRHLLAHKDGIVDKQYIQNTGDQSYNIGQRLVIHSQEVLDMVVFLNKVCVGIQLSCAKAHDGASDIK